MHKYGKSLYIYLNNFILYFRIWSKIASESITESRIVDLDHCAIVDTNRSKELYRGANNMPSYFIEEAGVNLKIFIFGCQVKRQFGAQVWYDLYYIYYILMFIIFKFEFISILLINHIIIILCYYHYYYYIIIIYSC